MIPQLIGLMLVLVGFSRTREGDPIVSATEIDVCLFVFPAHAGVIPAYGLQRTQIMSFSRTRGGDPSIVQAELKAKAFFPHTRG